MVDGIRRFADERRIPRLCHFTRLSSLRGIVRHGGIRPSAELRVDQVNDPERFDRHVGYVCCSVTFPNVYLLREFAGPNLNAWCVLLLGRDLLWQPGVLFCPVNAATAAGAFIDEGLPGLEALYVEEIAVGNRRWRRGPQQPLSATTDNQAEVLVPGEIPLASIQEIVVPTDRAHEEATDVLDGWPSGRRSPKLRIEGRMFRPDAYWGGGLFADRLPVSGEGD